MGDLIGLLVGAAIFFIELAFAIVQQCNDHTDKRSLERLASCIVLCSAQKVKCGYACA